jgi:hypothetical protein
VKEEKLFYQNALRELVEKIEKFSGHDFVHVIDRREETRPSHAPEDYLDFVLAVGQKLNEDNLTEEESRILLSRLMMHVLNESSRRIQSNVSPPYLDKALEIAARLPISDQVAEWLLAESKKIITAKRSGQRPVWGDLISFDIIKATRHKAILLPT